MSIIRTHSNRVKSLPAHGAAAFTRLMQIKDPSAEPSNKNNLA